MRILFVSPVRRNPDAGASGVYHGFADGLRQLGHTVDLFHQEDILGYPGKVQDKFLMPDIVSRFLLKDRRWEGYDVVQVPSGLGWKAFKKISRARRRPGRPLLVNQIHGLSFFDHESRLGEARRGHLRLSPQYRLITGRLPVWWDSKGVESADITLVFTTRDRDLLADEHSARAATIYRIVPPISETFFCEPVHRSPDSARAIRLLVWGSWIARKGVAYLVPAFEALAEKLEGVTLTIGGAGLPADRVLADFSPGHRYRVSVLPHVDRRVQIELFDQHDIMLFPSLSEGFGLAVLEAMARGLTVITTFTGIGYDLLLPGENAVVIPTACSSCLADAVLRLIADDGLRTGIGKRARETALLHGPSECCRRLAEIYQENLPR